MGPTKDDVVTAINEAVSRVYDRFPDSEDEQSTETIALRAKLLADAAAISQSADRTERAGGPQENYGTLLTLAQRICPEGEDDEALLAKMDQRAIWD